jgi:DASS family divalent anion:Na+ symporter
MFSGMVSLSLSSALWFTAMAANPLGAEMARTFGLTIDFGSWLVASVVPTLAAMVLMPWVLQRIMSPEVKDFLIEKGFNPQMGARPLNARSSAIWRTPWPS